MKRETELGRILLAVGIIGLGVIGLVHGDFVRKWQPVPAWVLLRQPLSWVSNLLLLACGIGLLLQRAAATAAFALAVFVSSWIILLHGPLVAGDPASLIAWGYLSGCLTVEVGALALWATLPTSSWAALSNTKYRARTLAVARLLLAPALALFGVSHLVYAHGLTALVPSWFPIKTQIVYFTGAAHIAAGVALLLGILPSFAATLEAVMMSSFVLLVDIPRFTTGLVHGPPWAVCFETAMVGAVWIVAGSLADIRISRKEVPAVPADPP